MKDSFDPTKCNVALLCGGTSGERDISLASGEGAFAALVEAGFSVTKYDPSSRTDLKALIDGSYDVAFLALHGRGGEDGQIQGFLELIGLPYTGSGIRASATAIDKSAAKVFYQSAGILTAPSITIWRDQPYSISEIVSTVSEHCVIKAATEGSSLGVFIVEGAKDIEEAIVEAFKYDDHILIEQYISGTELTVAVLDDGDPFALPIIEIVPQNDSYDFDSKYQPGGSEHICPARLSETVSEEIKAAAVAAHKALGCEGVSRSDFILDEAGRFWILETNTIPGMTATSLLPDAARVYGLSFPELCVFLVKSALRKQNR